MKDTHSNRTESNQHVLRLRSSGRARHAASSGTNERSVARHGLSWIALVAFGVTTALVASAQVPPSVRQLSAEPAVKPISIAVDHDGFTEPKLDVLVAATEIGRLQELHVDIGDRVTEGQVIAKLEDGLQRDAVKTARMRASMHGELDAAKAETELMKIRLEQLQSLADKQMARPDELKRAKADWEIAKAKELSALENDKLRQSELERYELQLQRRRILAPMDGTIAEIFHTPGEYVTPSDPAVVRMLVLDELYAVFNVPVEDVDEMQLGRLATVFLISLSKNVEGRIAAVSPEIDGESGTVRVKVLLDNRDRTLRSGDRCRLRMIRGVGRNPSAFGAQTHPVRRLARPKAIEAPGKR